MTLLSPSLKKSLIQTQMEDNSLGALVVVVRSFRYINWWNKIKLPIFEWIQLDFRNRIKILDLINQIDLWPRVAQVWVRY